MTAIEHTTHKHMTLVDLSNWEQYFLFTFRYSRAKNEITFFNADACVKVLYGLPIEMKKSTQISKKINQNTWFTKCGWNEKISIVAHLFSKNPHTHSRTVEEEKKKKRRNCNNNKSHMSWVLVCAFLASSVSLFLPLNSFFAFTSSFGSFILLISLRHANICILIAETYGTTISIPFVLWTICCKPHSCSVQFSTV